MLRYILFCFLSHLTHSHQPGIISDTRDPGQGESKGNRALLANGVEHHGQVIRGTGLGKDVQGQGISRKHKQNHEGHQNKLGEALQQVKRANCRLGTPRNQVPKGG